MKTTSIVWFKTDLRLHDNETLIRAIESSDEIIPVYCFDESHFTTTTFGTKKTGNFRAKFLLESLFDLDANLRKLGSGLIVVKGQPEIEIVKLAIQYNAQKVFCKNEVAHDEIHTNYLVKKELAKVNCELLTFNTNNLYHTNDLPFAVENIPDVFTNYRIKVEAKSTVRNPFEKPLSISSPTIEKLVLPSLSSLGLEDVEMDCRAAIQFKGGETEALKRLEVYFFETQAISSYKETRNGLIGENYSSKFSAWLALGCISAKEIYAQLKKYESKYTANQSTYWLVFELLWRDYFSLMMEKYKHLFFLKSGIKASANSRNSHNALLFDKWKNAKTGIDFIDANMLELKLTGFMSNRGRQNVASYLCNNLKLDWRYGAAYFEQQLIDYDVCSNWCNWAYIAGVGNDPRNNRVFNIDKQADDYDRNFEFRKLWLNAVE
jgi:deoxyribodipyrimidine photo-lyase